MKSPARVTSPPSKSLLIYDGECQFCYFWARRWQRASAGGIEILPLQETRVAEQFPEIPRAQFEAALHFIDSDGAVSRGAEAAFRALGQNPQKRRWIDLYLRWPWFARLTEVSYSVIAKNRR